MKPQLLIVSDVWGIKNANWLQEYVDILSSVYEIRIYDSCVLGNIDITDKSASDVHKQFIQKGIDVAVKKVLETETKKITILAFSIGGTIAWKAGLLGLNIEKLYAISSTRLRYETRKPNCGMYLYFGENDRYQPDSIWFSNFEINENIYQNKEHEMYREVDVIHTICEEIVKNTPISA